MVNLNIYFCACFCLLLILFVFLPLLFSISSSYNMAANNPCHYVLMPPCAVLSCCTEALTSRSCAMQGVHQRDQVTADGARAVYVGQHDARSGGGRLIP